LIIYLTYYYTVKYVHLDQTFQINGKISIQQKMNRKMKISTNENQQNEMGSSCGVNTKIGISSNRTTVK